MKILVFLLLFFVVALSQTQQATYLAQFDPRNLPSYIQDSKTRLNVPDTSNFSQLTTFGGIRHPFTYDNVQVSEQYGRTIAIGYFNDDDILDIVVAAPAGYSGDTRSQFIIGVVFILYGDGNGGYRPYWTPLAGPKNKSFFGYTIAPVDLDQDGRHELFASAKFSLNSDGTTDFTTNDVYYIRLAPGTPPPAGPWIRANVSDYSTPWTNLPCLQSNNVSHPLFGRINIASEIQVGGLNDSHSLVFIGNSEAYQFPETATGLLSVGNICICPFNKETLSASVCTRIDSTDFGITPTNIALFGDSISLWDRDGDGVHDAVAIGSPGQQGASSNKDDGVVYIANFIWRKNDSLVLFDKNFFLGSLQDQYGRDVFWVPDHSGDGLPDLFAGTPFARECLPTCTLSIGGLFPIALGAKNQILSTGPLLVSWGQVNTQKMGYSFAWNWAQNNSLEFFAVITDFSAGNSSVEGNILRVVPELCGNGQLFGVEQCDDSNTNSNDGCSATCQLESGFSCSGSPSICSPNCGDGVTVGTETCDDGNTNSNDGCSATCQLESGFSCSGSPSICSSICGDGLIVGTEACDDSNTISNDGCSATCQLESGFSCSGSPSICSPICGDGLIVGTETCDDSNTISNDGCSATCQLESGYSCSGSPSICSSICGDGVIVGSEQCDDSNTISNDGCSATCQLESGFSCSSSPSSCSPICGDGLIVGSEQCDDSNTNSNDGCSATCQIESGYSCMGQPSTCMLNCGNGQQDAPTEQCDDGNTISGDGCSMCQIDGPGWNCTFGQLCTSTCGDGFAVGTETCDDSNTNSNDGCSATCQTESGYSCSGSPSSCSPICGDGIIVGTETCDDGNTNSNDGCSATCQLESGYSCSGSPSICSSICGDGLIVGTETCDDGNIISNDGCSANCQLESGFSCSGSPSICSPICGDGLIVGSEQCDDSNTISNDGCSATCQIESGYSCSGSPSICSSICGDGLIVGSEQCDDSNTNSNDGCSTTCQGETGWECANSSPPSICNGICGDGLIVGTETCDDDNTNSGDGCSDICQRESGYSCSGLPSSCSPICGDGLIVGTEQCDDSNTISNDGCSTTCQIESGFSCSSSPSICSPNCGDGIVAGSEQCDGVSGCSSSCQPLSGWTCTANVCKALKCGDKIVAGSEQCDGVSGCSSSCQPLSGWTCASNVCTSNCGDGILAVGAEQCDIIDLNNGGDGCDNCQILPGWVCEDNSCTILTTICGDGKVAKDVEECDDGNTNSNDGCDACAKINGWYCQTVNGASQCITQCGDNIQAGMEQCDAGTNPDPSTGCDSQCLFICDPADACCSDDGAILSQGSVCFTDQNGCTISCDGVQSTCPQVDLCNPTDDCCDNTTCTVRPTTTTCFDATQGCTTYCDGINGACPSSTTTSGTWNTDEAQMQIQQGMCGSMIPPTEPTTTDSTTTESTTTESTTTESTTTEPSTEPGNTSDQTGDDGDDDDGDPRFDPRNFMWIRFKFMRELDSRGRYMHGRSNNVPTFRAHCPLVSVQRFDSFYQLNIFGRVPISPKRRGRRNYVNTGISLLYFFNDGQVNGFDVPANSIKFSVNYTAWPFDQRDHKLELRLELFVPFRSNWNFEQQGNLVYITATDRSGFERYITFPTDVILDGQANVAEIQGRTLGLSGRRYDIRIVFENFDHTLEYDPVATLPKKNSNELSGGEIAAISVTSFLFIICLGVLAFYGLYRYKRSQAASSYTFVQDE